jgi:hypothetical protein
MANKPTATIHSVWADSVGKTIRLSFNIELKKTALGNWDIEAMRSDGLSVLAKIDALSECQLMAAMLEFPLDFSTTGFKATPDAESSARRGALAFFLGTPGENQRQESVEILVGDPKREVLDLGGRVIRLKTSHSLVTDLIDAVKGHARTTYGETVQDYNTSIYRQRALTKRSRQAA